VSLRVDRRPLDDEGWRAFAGAQSDALPFHDPAWAEVLTGAYGYEAFVAVAIDTNDRVRAGLPIVEVRRPFGPRRWLALPFTDYCPPLSETDAAASALIAGLNDLRTSAGVASIEFRAEVTGSSYPVGFRHVLTLDPDPDVTFAGLHKNQVQRGIKKALREGILTSRISRDRTDLDAFLRLHVATRRRLGVPVQPPAFFDRLWERLILEGHGFLVLADAGETTVSAALFLSGRSSLIYKFSASDSAAWGLRPNHLVLWTAIEHACRNGYEMFDFGRTETTHEGLRAFKAGWGTDEITLRYSVLGREAPVVDDGERAASLSATIIRHSPAMVCRLAGRALYRYAA
jgi:CelD/BcsL family acetyltransferase involved in cellulose biosynthesis